MGLNKEAHLMKGSCPKLNELLNAEIEVIKRHLDEHKWFQHIVDDSDGAIDFIEKYGWLMREMYCSYCCPMKGHCEWEKSFISQDCEVEETVVLVKKTIIMDEKLANKLLAFGKDNFDGIDEDVIVNWAINKILKDRLD
jgi:hypothetical protein